MIVSQGDMARVYSGLFDDFAIRHDDGRTITTLDGLNNYLISAALFGDSLLINDGHVLLNPAVQTAVLNERKSPLRTLVACGFVKILTRNKGALGSLADVMADDRITSAEDLVKADTFRRVYQPKLEQWATELGTDSFARWPAIRRDDVYASVSKTALRALIAIDAAHATEFRRFKNELGAALGMRTAWENVGRRLLETERLSAEAFRALMHAANESYQYAWGCMLSDFSEPVGIQMRLPRLLGGLDLTIGEPTEAKRPNMRFYVRDDGFADRAVKKRWQLLSQVVTPGTDVYELKRRFRRDLTRYYTSDEVSDRDMRRAVKDYSHALSRHFARTGLTGLGIDTTFGLAGIAVPLLVAGPVGPIVVGAAIAVGGIAASRVDVAGNFLWKLRAPDERKWIQDLPVPPPESVISSFQLDPKNAAPHLKNATSPNRA